MSASQTEFLGLGFTPSTLDAAFDLVCRRADARGPFAYVATPNVDHVVRLAQQPELRPIYDRAWLLLNDSRILELLARAAGLDLPAAAGADLTERLFAAAIDPAEPVTLLGGSRVAAEALRERYGLQDLRHHVPPMGLRTNPQALAAAAAFAAAQKSRFVFLAVGSPQQEMLAAAIAQRGDAVGVGLCIGAGIDFLTGEQMRAPVWMREARLEWAHRLLSDPGRMARRYLVDNPKILSLWAAWMLAQREGSRASMTARSSV